MAKIGSVRELEADKMAFEAAMQVRPAGEPFPGVVMFLTALAAAGSDELREWIAANGLGAGAAAWLLAEGMGPYAFYRLREAGVLDQLQPNAAATVREAYYTSAAGRMLLAAEAEALLAALRPLTVDPILLKGMALGTTLYPAAPTRPVSDLDILIERSQVRVVKQVLQDRGYQDMGLDPDEHQAFTNHLHVWREYGGKNKVAIEAHWNLVHDPAYARQLDLAGVRARAQWADFGSYRALVLDPVDQLIHACAHLLLHHAENWHQVWLLDLRLLVGRYGETWDWATVMDRASVAHLGGAVKYWLGLTEAWYGPFLPERARQALAAVQPAAMEQPHLAAASGDHQRVWQLVWGRTWGSGGWRGRLVYIGETFFPPWAYMQYRYRARSRWFAPFYYGWRLVRAALVAFR